MKMKIEVILLLICISFVSC
jgi:pimeloyl-ACP methyl ester carboxylesterase